MPKTKNSKTAEEGLTKKFEQYLAGLSPAERTQMIAHLKGGSESNEQHDDLATILKPLGDKIDGLCARLDAHEASLIQVQMSASLDREETNRALADLRDESVAAREADRLQREEDAEKAADEERQRKKPGPKPKDWDLLLMKEGAPLTEVQVRAKKALLELALHKFLVVTGLDQNTTSFPLETGLIWTPNRSYHVPDFEEPINRGINVAVLQRVTSNVLDTITDDDVYKLISDNITSDDISAASKKVFHDFRRRIHAKNDALKEIRERENRRKSRKQHKFNQLVGACTAYDQKHGRDPSPLLAIELMSDQDSDGEGNIVVTRPAYRSAKAVLDELWDLHRSKHKNPVRVRKVKATKSEELPKFADLCPFQVDKNYKSYTEKEKLDAVMTGLDPPGFEVSSDEEEGDEEEGDDEDDEAVGI